MNCETVRDRLMDYLDGEHLSSTGESIQEHLGSCLDCRRELMVLRELQEEAARLRTPEMPAEDLWPGIESRLVGESPGGRNTFFGTWSLRLLAAAAMLTLVVGSSIWLLGPMHEERAANLPASSEETIDLSARADQARVESGVIQLRRDLLGELDRRRDEIEPETWYAIEASLRELDHAIGEIHLALDSNPEDQRLNHLLANRYRQELDFLRRITRA